MLETNGDLRRRVQPTPEALRSHRREKIFSCGTSSNSLGERRRKNDRNLRGRRGEDIGKQRESSRLREEMKKNGPKKRPNLYVRMPFITIGKEEDRGEQHHAKMKIKKEMKQKIRARASDLLPEGRHTNWGGLYINAGMERKGDTKGRKEGTQKHSQNHSTTKSS